MTKKTLLYVFSFLLAMLILITISLKVHLDSVMEQKLRLDKPELLVVQPGQYAHYLINRLYEKKILDSPVEIKIALKLNPDLSIVRSGTYQIDADMSVNDLFVMLSTGLEKQFSIQLIEGLTWKDWKKQLNAHAFLSGELLNDNDWVSFLGEKPEGGSIEGWLLPETYYFTAKTPSVDVVKRAYFDMQAYLEDAWQNRALDLPYDTPYEALILASIIEKETGVASERPRISGVFINRLRLGMRLQTDPTVIYGMGEAFDGNIRRKDLRTPTAYNTYVIKGLPPTPIAMPSKLAIDAAMHPLDTPELYFVSKGDGSHQFSQTLAEHNKAVRKYQLQK